MKLECSYVQLPKIYSFLTGNELKVFTVIFDEWSMMKNEDGWYYRSWKDLRVDTGLSNDGLNNALNGLLSKNLLRKKEYPKKEQRSNDYQINLEGVYALANIPTPKNRVTYSEKQSTSKNIITKEKNKIYNINTSTGIHTSNYTPDEENKKYKTKNINMKKSNSVMSHVDNIIQPDGVNNINSDELSNFNDVVMSGVEVEEDFLKFEENERSDNGTTAMSAISKGEAMLRNATNKMITSTQGNNITSTSGNGEHKVQSDKVISDSSIFSENCPKPYLTPQIPLTPLSFPSAWNEDAIFGSEERQNVSVDKLSTNEEKTQPEPQECPQIEFNREEMIRLMDMSANETDLDRFKEQLKKMDEYMQWLKLNDSFQYKLYVKEIYCWFNSHNWNMEFDFISLGGEFMRKYVA